MGWEKISGVLRERLTNYEKYIIFYHSLLKLAWKIFAFAWDSENFLKMLISQ